jgi:hypothetical protein
MCVVQIGTAAPQSRVSSIRSTFCCAQNWLRNLFLKLGKP